MSRLERHGWLLAAGFWTICGTVSGLQIWISMIAHHHSLPLVIAYQILVWNGWLLLTPAVQALVRRAPLAPPTARGIVTHVVAAILFGVVHAIFWTCLLIVMQPYDAMTPPPFIGALGGIMFSGMPLELLLYCGVVAAAIARQWYREARDRELRAAQLERLLAEARLHALELQLQPHFLFNTLNAISSLVRASRSREAVVMIAGLSDLLRYTLDHAGQQRVSIEEETAILQRYLEIQQTRFSDRLTFQIDVAENARRAAVPTLILQPLAENAIRHGLSQSAGSGHVGVKAFREGDRLRIEMFNTGTLEDASKRGLGLRNTADRLQQLYGDAHRFELRGDRDGVVAALDIPWSSVA